VRRTRLHKTSGTETVTIQAAQSQAAVTQADVQAANGVLHTIDAVLIPSAVAECRTCAQLRWDAGGDGVCAESDDGFSCQSGLDFHRAEQACADFGARLCTAGELLSGEGRGTGCGHDARYIWSTSGSYSRRVNRVLTSLTCGPGERLAVLGDSKHAAGSQPPAECLAADGGAASLRCCADTVCRHH
jgi:hypothetical protein